MLNLVKLKTLHTNVDTVTISHVCMQSNQFLITFKPRYLKQMKCIFDFCIYVWVWGGTTAQINLGRLVINVYRTYAISHPHTFTHTHTHSQQDFSERGACEFT
jgi:hypothetical protein